MVMCSGRNVHRSILEKVSDELDAALLGGISIAMVLDPIDDPNGRVEFLTDVPTQPTQRC
jgi:hypothetical protein